MLLTREPSTVNHWMSADGLVLMFRGGAHKILTFRAACPFSEISELCPLTHTLSPKGRGAIDEAPHLRWVREPGRERNA